MKITKVGVAIINNGKVLVVKETGWKKYGIPGGTVKHNEKDIGCLRREINEELNSDIKPNSVEYLGTFEDIAMNEPNKIIQIKLYKVELEREPRGSNEIEDMFWFSKNDNLDDLGPIDKNHLIPALIKQGLIK